MERLKGQVALVAGAARGAGRGIACMLGEAGCTVYCSGRSTRTAPSSIGRPETIEETAELVAEKGGIGIPVKIDHTKPEEVELLFGKIDQERSGRLDILVNVISGDWDIGWGRISTGGQFRPFWQESLANGLKAQLSGVHTHLIASYYAAKLMTRNRKGLIVELNDGNRLQYNDAGIYYSLTKTSAILMSYFMSVELAEYHVAVVCITPGYMRSEQMLDKKFGVTEANWREAVKADPYFLHSETPFYVGRAVVALACDPNIMAKTGCALSSGALAKEYGFTDIDGRQPICYDGQGSFADGQFTIKGKGREWTS